MLPRIVVVAAASALAAGASAAIVQGTELAPYQDVTNQLAMSHGVIFSSLNYPAVTFTELVPGLWGIQGAEPWAPPSNGGWYNSPIFATFVNPADGVTPAVVNGTVSARWGDGGGDFDAVDMRAYDLSNNLLAAQTFTGTTFTVISLTANGIARVEFWANTNVGAGTSDTGLDWLSFPTPFVPAPGAGAALAIAGATLARRRR
ncbi:MAG: hypothetical protein KF684_11785 [Phycisphaeraceae bacterium]|nr:hypothetical protein [Phycisphaeraceae bacterium]